MSRANSVYQRNQRVNNRQISVLETVQIHGQNKYSQPGPSRYMPGLDGLRALAVLAVIAYHLNSAWAPGGLLGVCLFFVLSGYLITDLLAVQWSLSGRMDLKDFWLRRARRLLPALFVMLTGAMAWTALFSPNQLTSLWEDTLAAVFYASNWWFIFHHVSYFASFGPPSPLGHLWSLAVEEQFYLVWPLLLWLGLRYVPRRGRLVGLTIAGALVSALAMGLIYQPGTDPSRVYYGTDTRAFAFLMGAALALVWPSRKLSAKLPHRARWTLDVVGGVGLFVVLWMIWRSNEYETFLYRGGLLLFSLASTVVVAVLAHPASRLSKLFGKQPWQWLGVCSYGIYLWHYPLIVWTTPAVNTGGPDVLLTLKQMLTCIVLAGLSWRFIEEPIRRGTWKKPRRHLRRSKRRQILEPVNGRVTLISAFLLLGVSCLVIIGGVFTTNTKWTSIFASIAGASQSSEIQAAPESRNPIQGSSLLPNPKTFAQRVREMKMKTQAPENGTANFSPIPEPELNTPTDESSAFKFEAGATGNTEAGKGVTVIGDSVMVGVEPVLKKLLPGIVIDAQEGRQMNQAPSVVAQLKAQGNLGKRVIIELGTNGPFTEEQLTTLLSSLGQMEQIVLINTRVSRPWESVVNQTLVQVAATYPHTTLVNWYSASSDHDAYFYPDGVHLNPTGIQAYASLVAKAIDPL